MRLSSVKLSLKNIRAPNSGNEARAEIDHVSILAFDLSFAMKQNMRTRPELSYAGVPETMAACRASHLDGGHRKRTYIRETGLGLKGDIKINGCGGKLAQVQTPQK
jgi:hypothetical protein